MLKLWKTIYDDNCNQECNIQELTRIYGVKSGGQVKEALACYRVGQAVGLGGRLEA